MSDSFKTSMNKANPNQLADQLRDLKVGDRMAALPTALCGKAPAVDASNLATVVVVKLPDDQKAATILRSYMRAGTAGVGENAPQAYGATPATTQVAVTPCGDIAYLGTDAPTSVDVLYVPEQGDVLELELAVVSNALAVPTQYASKVKMLLSAEVTAGTSLGVKIVETPSGSAASAGSARLDLAKANVKFNSGLGATKAKVKLLLWPSTDVSAKLQGDATY